jgi:hypothetical protein
MATAVFACLRALAALAVALATALAAEFSVSIKVAFPLELSRPGQETFGDPCV